MFQQVVLDYSAFVHEIRAHNSDIKDLLQTLIKQGEKVMAQIDDLKTAVAAEDAEIVQVIALVQTQLAKISDLQNQLAAAVANAAPDLSGLITDVQNQTTALSAALGGGTTPAPAATATATSTPTASSGS